MRKLASIQRVWKLESIEGADRIELAHVLGWQCVVNKGQFREGDLGVYFEIDSFLPVTAAFEFLRNSSFKHSDILGDGFRLRTMRFKGQLSQGLILPVSVFPELSDLVIKEYMDVTERLCVRKYEIPERVTSAGTIIGELPPEIPHTDETRIQSAPELLDEFKELPFYISTKMDGSSHSCCIDEEGDFHVTGHNYEYADDGKSDYYTLLKDRQIEQKMRRYMDDNHLKTLTLQGEFCGEGIQKNRLKLKKPEWYVFTVRYDGERVSLDELMHCCRELGLQHVPIEEVGENLKERYPTVEALLERADGEYPCGGKKEGIVVRPVDPVYCPLISASLSFKVVNNKYLLKQG